MELWVAGIALLIIATGILVLILCGKKIHKSLQIAGACVLGVLFVAVLGYIVLTLHSSGWVLKRPSRFDFMKTH